MNTKQKKVLVKHFKVKQSEKLHNIGEMYAVSSC